MQGRDFLRVASSAVLGPNEAYWRAAIVHAYYALLLEARDFLSSWGFHLPTRQNLHTWVRLKLLYAEHPDLKQVGLALDELCQLRNRASYHLGPSQDFADSSVAEQSVFAASLAVAIFEALSQQEPQRTHAIESIHA